MCFLAANLFSTYSYDFVPSCIYCFVPLLFWTGINQTKYQNLVPPIFMILFHGPIVMILFHGRKCIVWSFALVFSIFLFSDRVLNFLPLYYKVLLRLCLWFYSTWYKILFQKFSHVDIFISWALEFCSIWFKVLFHWNVGICSMGAKIGELFFGV